MTEAIISCTTSSVAPPSDQSFESSAELKFTGLKILEVKIESEDQIKLDITRKHGGQAMKDDGSEQGVASSKYPNVHRMRSGRWQAWTNCITTPGASRGPYVGVHDTEKLAARAQDRSLLKHKALATKPIKLNFPEADYAPDEKLRNVLTNEEFLKMLAVEARACYRKVEPTKCLEIFLAEEKAQGTLPPDHRHLAKEKSKLHAYKVTPLREYLKHILMNRPDEGADETPNTPGPPAVAIGTNIELPAPILATNLNPADEEVELAWAGKRKRSALKY